MKSSGHMLALFVAMTVAAAPAAEPHKFTLAAPGLSYVGIDQDTGEVFLDYFTQQLGSKGGIRVTTRNEVATLIGLQKQKELLSCSDTGGTCFAELAGALGADGVITGSLAKLGTGYVANLKIMSSVTGEPMAIYSQRVPTEDAMLQFLEGAATDFISKVHESQGKPITLTEQKPVVDTSYERPVTPSGPTKLWIVPAVIGGLALGAAGYEYYQASSTSDRLQRGDEDITDKTGLDKVVADGKQQQQFAAIAAGVGVVSFGVMTAILLASGTDEPRPRLSLAPTPNGATLVFGGALP